MLNRKTGIKKKKPEILELNNMMSEIHSIAIASVSDWIKQKKKICEAEGRSFQITSQKSSKKKE